MKVSQEIILETAMRLLEANGIDGVSIRKLQTELQVTAPSIYWRYKSKQQLISAMSDFIITPGSTNSLAIGDIPWQEWLQRTLGEVRIAVLKRRDGAKVVATAGLLGTPSLARIIENGLSRMQGQNINESQASIILFACLHYTIGHILEEQSTEFSEVDQTEFLSQYPKLRSAVIRKQQELVDPEKVYLTGLDLLLRI